MAAEPWSLFHLQMTLVVLGLGCLLGSGYPCVAGYLRMIDWLRLRDPARWRAIGSPGMLVEVNSGTTEENRGWMRFDLGFDLHADPELAALQRRSRGLWAFMAASLGMIAAGAVAIPLARTVGLL